MTAQGFYGWGVLLILLVAAADFDATADVAAAFAVLLLVSVLLIYGPAAFDWLTTVVGGTVPAVSSSPAPTAPNEQGGRATIGGK